MMRNVLNLFPLWMVSLLLLLANHAASSAEVRVAVASNFAPTLRSLAQDFSKETGHDVKISTGSSGRFVAQIQRGAPYDVFFSADQHKIDVLDKLNLIQRDSRWTYALGSLVLWSSHADYFQSQSALKRLQELEFTKLALANPQLAPYGLAAQQVLDILGLRQHTQKKWVQGENIAQTYQFVSSGNADMGFVALAQMKLHSGTSPGSTWLVPTELYEPIRQDAALLSRAKDNATAQAFLRFMQSEHAQKVIEVSGYQTMPLPAALQ